ncbi:MAG: terpene cyclase/mutase family protein [Planctomycetota bacterium]|nr:terpene cyclase/mutase family protein [Planctomycetota bacterium]
MQQQRFIRGVVMALVACCLLLASPEGRADDDPDQRRREKAAEEAGVSRAEVSKAIDRGAQYLLKKYEGGFDATAWNSTLELVMLTLTHAGVDAQNEVYARGLKALETCKLEFTYRVAALAMVLARIDRWKYRARIAHCAQWLVDTQLQEGEWGYPRTLKTPMEVPKPVAVPAPVDGSRELVKPEDRYGAPMLKIRKKRSKHIHIKSVGDISNTQFAILGLKACLDARIEIPKSTWKAALGYIRKYQNKDGGWGYAYAGQRDNTSYGSMTCAGVCSVAICRHGLGSSKPEKHAAIRRGVAWLGKYFKVDENHGIAESRVADPLRWRFYYLYSIERVGQIVGTDTMGDKPWYPLGARYLIDQQKDDGGWWTGVEGVQWRQAGDIQTADTCFAVLFLTRSTPRLRTPVVTGGHDKKK